MSKVGVSDFKYAIMSKDDETGVTYGNFVSIPGLNHIEVTPNSNTATNYGDNAPMEVATAMGDVTIAIDSVLLPQKDEAALLGHEIDSTTKAMIYNAEDEAPYVAIMFTGLNADGKRSFVKVLKVKFQEIAETYDTKTDTPNFQNPHIEGAAAVRIYDKQWKRKLTEDGVNVTQTEIDAFIASVEA